MRSRGRGLRVLILSPAFGPPGGVQYVGRLMAAALEHRFGPGLALDAVSLHDGPDPPRDVPTARWAGCRGRLWRFAAASAASLAGRRYDAVIVNHVRLLPLLASPHVRRRAAVLVVHGVESWETLPRWRLLGAGRLSRILFASEFSRRRSVTANPSLGSVPGVVCHHGLFGEAGPGPAGRGPADPASGDGPAGEAASAALMIGRMASGERYKGFDEMIGVWPRVRRRRPDAELWIVGDGDDRRRLEAAASGVDGVRFLGPVDDRAREELLRRCRCFCLPSKGEGFGLVYLEAMRAGRPVLCGDGDAGAEVVVDGTTGYAVDPDDPERLAARVTELLGEPAAALGAAGRTRFLANFTLRAYAARFGDCIESALAEGSHRAGGGIR